MKLEKLQKKYEKKVKKAENKLVRGFCNLIEGKEDTIIDYLNKIALDLQNEKVAKTSEAGE